MAMRLSGLMSGMDTESVIQQLVEARSNKVTKAKNEQTKLEWKQEAWKELNTKLKTLQSKLNDLRFTGGYSKKATKVSDSSVASVLTAGDAMNGTYSLAVNKLAKTAYLTGGKVSTKSNVQGEVVGLTPMKFLMDFKNDASGKEMAKHLTVQKGDGSKVDIQLTSDSSISDVITQLKEAGLNANFDEKQKRFFISSKEAGANQGFMITGDADALEALKLGGVKSGGQVKKFGDPDFKLTGQTLLGDWMDFRAEDGQYALSLAMKVNGNKIMVDSWMTVDQFVQRLREEGGINVSFDEREQKFFFDNSVKASDFDHPHEFSGPELVNWGPVYYRFREAMGINAIPNDASGSMSANYISGQDAEIELNGATFTSSNNVFDINGLTITAQAETEPGKTVTLTTGQDTDGIYGMVKDFLKAYNEVIDEMDKLYGADAAKDYEPLSDEEKANMSESEIEKYEKKIKDGLLRRDENLNSVATAMKQAMLGGVKVDGITMYLSSFGISTLNYFLAKDGERNSYHIDGDTDDSYTSANEDKLKKMIATEPDKVSSFFSQLTMNLYTAMDKQSKSIEGYRSFGSFYDDKKMKSDYDDYKTKIKDLEKKLADYEDKWYAKFAAMETAMAKMQGSANAITGLLGGS